MADYRCSFCGKRQDEVNKLIAGGGSNRPYICDECVALCKQIIDEEFSAQPELPQRSGGWFDRLRRMAVSLPR